MKSQVDAREPTWCSDCVADPRFIRLCTLHAAAPALYAECERQRKMLDALAPLAFHDEASRYLPGNVGDELKAWIKEPRATDALVTGESEEHNQ